MSATMAGMTLVSQFIQTVSGEITSKVKTFLLVIGLAGTGICAFMVGDQVIATLSYQSSVATIDGSGYRCRTATGWRGCKKSEIDRAEAAGEKIKNEFRVTFTFPDATGTTHQVTGYITKTGLPRNEAVKGAQFNMLYDPSDPKKTSLPLGADYHALVVGLAGIAALAFHVFFFGLPTWPRRRGDDALTA